MVKKVVEIRNGAYNVASSDTASLSSSEQILDDDEDDEMDRLASGYKKGMEDDSFSTEMSDGSVIFADSHINMDTIKVPSHSQTRRVEINGENDEVGLYASGKESIVINDVSNLQSEVNDSPKVDATKSALAPLPAEHDRVSNKQSHDDFMVHSMNQPKLVERRPPKKNGVASVSMESGNTEREQATSNVDEICWESSRVKKLRASESISGGAYSPPSFMIQVFGESATDDIAGRSLGLRACALLDGDKRIVGIDVSNCPVKCAASVIESVCPEGEVGGSDVNLDIQRDIKNMILARVGHEMKSVDFYQVNFFDRVKHLCFTNTLIKTLMCHSINRFENLVTLDLSNNYIEILEENLMLPSLLNLDLSGNQLTTLDHLQGLVNLRYLNVSANKLQSLHLSMYMLVPLAGHLISLDMSMNRVCDLPRYAEEAALLFPILKYFDTVDMSYVTGAYTSHGDVADIPTRAPSMLFRSSTFESSQNMQLQSAGVYSSLERGVIGDSAIEHSESPPPISMRPRGAPSFSDSISRNGGYESGFLTSMNLSQKKMQQEGYTTQAPTLTSPEPDRMELDKTREERFRRAFTRASRFRLSQTYFSSHEFTDKTRFDDLYPSYQNPSYSVKMYASPGVSRSRFDTRDLHLSYSEVPHLPCEQDKDKDKNSARLHKSTRGTRSSSPAPSRGYLKPTASATVRYQSPLRDNHTLAFRHRSDSAEAEWVRSQNKVFSKTSSIIEQRQKTKKKGVRKGQERILARSLEYFIAERKKGLAITADDDLSLDSSCAESDAIPWDRNFGLSTTIANPESGEMMTSLSPKKMIVLSESFDTVSDTEMDNMELRVSKAVIAALRSSREGHASHPKATSGIEKKAHYAMQVSV
jgi:Leucine-rich repeat (LRR) protein